MTPCRHCGAPLELVFADLGTAPPSNAYLAAEALSGAEAWFPLEVLVCESCWLVQARDVAGALFDENYAYFSAFSASWLAHSEAYVTQMQDRFGLGPHSTVVEVAANDGYLLQYVRARGIPCYGIEPTASTAAAARARGIEIVEDFFGEALGTKLAAQGRGADLMAANNVLAHVPDIVDFARGFAALLTPAGVATFEFPHLLQLIAQNQFDTIYHEHYAYLSLVAVERVFARAGLTLFDVEEVPTHGGSLRVFAQRADTGAQPVRATVADMLARERAAGLETPAPYRAFQAQADGVRDGVQRFLLEARAEGRRVAAYGAAAKGNTLLNFAGIRAPQIEVVADANPAKQGQYMPGSRIPIVTPEALMAREVDDVLILPWNIAEEVARTLAPMTARGVRLWRAVPGMQQVG